MSDHRPSPTARRPFARLGLACCLMLASTAIQAATPKTALVMAWNIDAISTADIKARSRWSRALRYAWRERKAWTDLKSFLRENGGPAGCAAEFAAVHPKARYPGCIVYRCCGTGRPYLVIDKPGMERLGR